MRRLLSPADIRNFHQILAVFVISENINLMLPTKFYHLTQFFCRYGHVSRGWPWFKLNNLEFCSPNLNKAKKT